MNLSHDEPSDWLLANLDLIARDRPVLDVACGRGRHALLLAEKGWRVRAIDRDAAALADLATQARVRALAVETEQVELELREVDLGTGRYGTVVVFNYLPRPLMPSIVRALVPGGVLIYETFTIGQRERGHPSNPAFLLGNGELPLLVAPLAVLRQRAGDFGGKLLASVAAKKR